MIFSGSRQRLWGGVVAVWAASQIWVFPAVVTDFNFLGLACDNHENGFPFSKLFEPIENTVDSSFGCLAGQNLYYSFRTLDVGPAEPLTFKLSDEVALDSNVKNIIVRHTGHLRQVTIGGNVTVEGGSGPVNLILMNLGGFLFEKGAEVDVSGSFAAFGGDYLLFNDFAEDHWGNIGWKYWSGGVQAFDQARKIGGKIPEEGARLSSADPIALGYVDQNVGAGFGFVTVNGATIEVGAGRGVVLSGRTQTSVNADGESGEAFIVDSSQGGAGAIGRITLSGTQPPRGTDTGSQRDRCEVVDEIFASHDPSGEDRSGRSRSDLGRDVCLLLADAFPNPLLGGGNSETALQTELPALERTGQAVALRAEEVVVDRSQLTVRSSGVRIVGGELELVRSSIELFEPNDQADTISLTGKNILVSNKSTLQTHASVGTALSEASLGSVEIDYAETFVMDASEIATETRTESNAGNIRIGGDSDRTGDSFLMVNSQLESSSYGDRHVLGDDFIPGSTGKIQLQSSGSMVLSESQLSTNSVDAGGGAISISAEGPVLIRASELTTQGREQGEIEVLSGAATVLSRSRLTTQSLLTGGGIAFQEVESPNGVVPNERFVAVGDGSGIDAKGVFGDGGTVLLSHGGSDSIPSAIISPEATITASSENADSGTVLGVVANLGVVTVDLSSELSEVEEVAESANVRVFEPGGYVAPGRARIEGGDGLPIYDRPARDKESVLGRGKTRGRNEREPQPSTVESGTGENAIPGRARLGKANDNR